MPDQGSAPAKQIAQFRSDGITAQTGLRIPFFTDAFSRAFGFPATVPVNVISEETPLREERPFVPFVGLREIHYSRPALVTGSNLGAGPIRGVFRAPQLYGGGLFVVSGQGAYNVATGAGCGAIPGADRVRWAASEHQLVLVANGTAYLFDGAVFNPIVNPSLPPLSDVAWLAGRFIYMAVGTDQFWYSEIDDAANETGLDFATAEAAPDPNVAVSVLNDEAVIFGTQSVEFWSVTQDPAAPFQPNIGRGFQRGCASRDSIVFADNSLFWVGDNLVVYRVGNAPARVSSSSIEDKLRQCATPGQITALALTFEGHEFYVLNVPGVGTYAYDISRIGTQSQAYGDSYQRGEWQEWQSWGQPTFRGQVGVMMNGVAWVGDNATNDLWTMRVGVYSDANGPFTRMASAFIKIEEGQPRCQNIVLHGLVGQGLATGQGSSPLVEMRWSDDQGRTFTDWRAATLGRGGAYRVRAFWQRLGLLRAPGRLVQVRVSDPVNVVFSHLELNAARPAY
ncbi:MAG: hypothetical protein JWO83_4515 [Caulobacteraceae bacterium]|nr:hypothetical protein [Caulobacteraceae bacterium]